MNSKKSATRSTPKPAHVHANCLELPHNHGYTGPVAERSSADWNPDAHGADCITYVCECHAVQRVNVRGDEIERGEWHTDADTASHHLQIQAAQSLQHAAEALAAAVEGQCDTAPERCMLTQALADLDAAVMLAARPKRAAPATAAA